MAVAVAAYEQALQASTKVHEAMLRPVLDVGDNAAVRQYQALKAFAAAIKGFADATLAGRPVRWWQVWR